MYIDSTIWETIGTVFLIAVSILMLLLFKRKPAESEKALLIGVGFFILTIFFNVVGLEEISDYFSVLGFVVIAACLLRLFWADTDKLK